LVKQKGLFLESALAGLERGHAAPTKTGRRRIDELEAGMKLLNEVVVELTAENIEKKRTWHS